MQVSCHCKNIQISIEPPQQVTICNCSICSRYQALWGYYHPTEVSIEIGHKGEDIYIWGDKQLEFVRCKTCGCVTHYQSINDEQNPVVGVNFRMSQDATIASIPIRHFNGKELL